MAKAKKTAPAATEAPATTTAEAPAATPATTEAPAPATPPATEAPAAETKASQVKSRAKRTKASNIDDVIQLLKDASVKDAKVDKAIAALEKLKDSLVTKKERKPRAPTPFNLFVSKKMAELKDSGMSTNERMKECARLWKVEKGKK